MSDELVPQTHGGALKRGGANAGSGRPKKDFRVAAGKVALEHLAYWAKVAKGNKCVVVPGRNGSKDTLRRPTHEEQERAYVNVFLRFGIGTQDEVTVLGSTEQLDAFADVLGDFEGRILDGDLMDAILVAVGDRLNGQGQ